VALNFPNSNFHLQEWDGFSKETIMLHLFNMPLIYKTKIDRPRPFRRSRLTMIRALTIRATRENDLAVGQLASALHCGLSLNELSSAGQPGY
jgi:hypothetical protein